MQILPELNIGGVERGTVDLAGKLIEHNNQAFVISNGGSLVKDLEAMGARHIQLPVHKKSLFSILINVPKVAKILQQEKIDIIHARSRVPALIAFLASRRTGTNFVTTAHGYYSENLASRVMGWGKYVIVSSQAIAQHMVEDFGVPSERIRLIPRGADLTSFKFRNRPELRNKKRDSFTIGVIGRLTPIKGHKYFLEALAKVVRVLPRAKALIVGDGKANFKEELKMLTRRLSLDKFVEFLGQDNNMASVYSQLDVLVLPTVTEEAFGRVIIEAGASGVPVIATKVGGVVDIIEDGVNGILVAPKDASSIASAIIRIFKQPELAKELTLAARKRVEEKFSLQQMAQRTIKVYKEVQANLRILVIKLSALGDVILAIPSLRALREKYPNAHIAVLTVARFGTILENCPYINQLLQFQLKNKSYKYIWRLSGLLRRLNFDIVIDLQNNRQSHILAYLSASSRRYGYDNGKFSFLLNHKVKEKNLPLSPVQHQAQTLRLLNIEPVKDNLELWPQAIDDKWAEDFLKKHRSSDTAPLIGINLEASPQWPTKRWGVEKFAALLDKLQDAGFEVVVTGRGQDQYWLQKLRQLSKSQFIDATGKTEILQLASLVKRCNVYITSDSAPLHIANAMNTSAVALFGPTDSRRHTIAGAKQIIIKKDLICSPCYKRNCHNHRCMKEISVEEVFAAAKGLL